LRDGRVLVGAGSYVEARVTVRLKESQLQGMVEEMAAIFGWTVCHIFPLRTQHGWRTPTTVKGFPDLLLWKPGRFLVRELKAAHGRLSPEQEKVLADLEAAGLDVGVWKPADLDSGRIQAELAS
jgi:hypothetical protein